MDTFTWALNGEGRMSSLSVTIVIIYCVSAILLTCDKIRLLHDHDRPHPPPPKNDGSNRPLKQRPAVGSNSLIIEENWITFV